MKKTKRIEITAFRRQLSIKSGEAIPGGSEEPWSNSETGPVLTRPLAEGSGRIGISRAEEITVRVQTLIETEEHGLSIRPGPARLQGMLRRLQSRFNTAFSRSGVSQDVAPPTENFAHTFLRRVFAGGRIMKQAFIVVCSIAIALSLAQLTQAQTTEFTYQGRLLFGGVPASGSFDFEFKLFDDAAAGTQQGQTLTLTAVNVNNGVFSVRLDFGNQFTGANRFLEISVRQTGDPSLTLLSPRQAITSAPYAIKSLNADSATNATSADTATNATQLGGVAANQFINTTDSRLTDARVPLAGSANYIQNGTVPQSASNFSISGNGLIGGSVGIGTTTPQQRLHVDGNEVLSTGFQSGFKFRDRGSTSANDDWVWYSAGNIARLFHAGVGDLLTIKTDGSFNIAGSSTFSTSILNAATQYNIGGQRVLSATGATNTFVGLNAGNANTANDNSFFGNGAGRANTIGTENSFFGTGAGNSNTTGSANSFFGFAAGTFNTTAHDNSFSGWFAGQRNTTGSLNSFFGSQSGQNNNTGSNNAFYGYASGRDNTTGTANSIFGTLAGFSNSTGARNAFFGAGAGGNNTTGNENAFFGSNTGAANTTGGDNSFFGFNAGSHNLAAENSFFGAAAGLNNTTGPFNSFFGTYSGFNTTTGGSNSFFGYATGFSNSTGFNNSFFGGRSGILNTTGALNSFFGYNSGSANTTGSANAFFGTGSGQNNTVGGDNSFFGVSSGFSNTTGGRNSFFGSDAGFSNTTGTDNAYFGINAGQLNINSSNNSFFGSGAGQNSTHGNNAFFGASSGQANTGGFLNAFFGAFAGQANTTAAHNSFFGGASGANTTTGDVNTFLGFNAGFSNVDGNANTLVGANTGANNISGVLNTMVGLQAGFGNTSGSSNAFLGAGAGDTNTGGSNNTAVGANADVSSGTLSFATAIGANAVVSASNTIQLGRANGNDKVRVPGLGSAGFTALCRNINNEISNCSSSLRYKTNINTFNSGLSLIKRLRPVSFNWKDGGAVDFGLVAEEVNKIEPLLTTTNDKGQVEGVKYDRLSVVLINAMKEQQVQVETQQKQIESQQAIINQQQIELDNEKRRLDSLKALVCSRKLQAGICRSQK